VSGPSSVTQCQMKGKHTVVINSVHPHSSSVFAIPCTCGALEAILQLLAL